MPKHLGEHEAQLGIRQVLANAVAHTNRPGLVSGVIVVGEERLVHVALRDEGVGVGEVVARKVGAKVGNTDTGLEKE